MMVELECPWCEEMGLLPLQELREAESSFTCADCGTTVELVEESVALDLAA